MDNDDTMDMTRSLPWRVAYINVIITYVQCDLSENKWLLPVDNGQWQLVLLQMWDEIFNEKKDKISQNFKGKCSAVLLLP